VCVCVVVVVWTVIVTSTDWFGQDARALGSVIPKIPNKTNLRNFEVCTWVNFVTGCDQLLKLSVLGEPHLVKSQLLSYYRSQDDRCRGLGRRNRTAGEGATHWKGGVVSCVVGAWVIREILREGKTWISLLCPFQDVSISTSLAEGRECRGTRDRVLWVPEERWIGGTNQIEECFSLIILYRSHDQYFSNGNHDLWHLPWRHDFWIPLGHRTGLAFFLPDEHLAWHAIVCLGLCWKCTSITTDWWTIGMGNSRNNWWRLSCVKISRYSIL